MKIPVFVSCPTDLNSTQDAARQLVLGLLDRYGLEPRALGRSDYPVNLPLREVLLLSKHCSGGVILGFEQFQAATGYRKARHASGELSRHSEVISHALESA